MYFFESLSVRVTYLPGRIRPSFGFIETEHPSGTEPSVVRMSMVTLGT